MSNQKPEEIKLTEHCTAAGCGCKISPGVLGEILKNKESSPTTSPNLLVGNDARDDAAAYEISPGQVLLSTTDFFTPIVDDPFDFGRVAAANAISDIYAMGGKPFLALSLLGWPLSSLPPESAGSTLQGAVEICKEAGVVIGGGHSIENKEPIFGLAVNGMVARNCLKTNKGARAGDLIFLTKPLGTGLYSTAWKRRAIQKADQELLVKQLTTLNKAGEVLGDLKEVHAMTDVTGFGLIGHLSEVCNSSSVSARLFIEKIPVMSSAQEYAKAGMVPGGSKKNKAALEKFLGEIPAELEAIVFDPQTNGGLLISVARDAEQEVRKILSRFQIDFDPIGEIIVPQKSSPLISFE